MKTGMRMKTRTRMRVKTGMRAGEGANGTAKNFKNLSIKLSGALVWGFRGEGYG